MADRIAKKIQEIEGTRVEVGYLDITPFRDDRQRRENEDESEIGFSLENKRIVLVDDVMYTGRSIRAAIDAIMSRARPKRIQLAILIDRGHREVPLRADFVGKNLPTSREEDVRVMVKERDGTDKVSIFTVGKD